MSESSEKCENETVIFFDIMEFLSEYEKFPCLWNKEHEKFRDRRERLKCEHILGGKLGINSLMCLRRKIRNVRGTYNSEIRKIKTCIDNGIEVCPPKLIWFARADRFLRQTTDLSIESFPIRNETNECRSAPKRPWMPKLLNLKGKSVVSVSSPPKRKKTEQSLDEVVTEEIVDQNLYKTTDSEEKYEELELLEEEEINDQDETFSIKFEEIDDFESDQNDANETTSSICEVSSPVAIEKGSQSRELNNVVRQLKDIATENEFAAFGRSIGLQLQNMPLDLALQLQMDIQSHITTTRLNYIQRNQHFLQSEADRCPLLGGHRLPLKISMTTGPALFESSGSGRCSVGRPLTRWTDDLVKVGGNSGYFFEILGQPAPCPAVDCDVM